jgi:hypothetical protein
MVNGETVNVSSRAADRMAWFMGTSRGRIARRLTEKKGRLDFSSRPS